MTQDALPSPVLVTGANGFIGRRVIEALAGRTEAIAATRDGRPGTRRLDLLDAASVPGAVAGVAAVIHCAVGDRRVTVDGTRMLLEAAARVGVRRVVHLSSIAVYGASEGVVREETAMVPAAGHGYAAWKAAAELACTAAKDLTIVRLRPTIVYGPDSEPWVLDIAERLRAGMYRLPGRRGEGVCNPVHVRDVAEAAVAGLQGSPGAYNINGPKCLTWNEWFHRIAIAAGAPAPRLVPAPWFYLQFATGQTIRLLNRAGLGSASVKHLFTPSPREFALFARRAHYPIDAARKALGWEPRVSLDAGLAECARALRSSG